MSVFNRYIGTNYESTSSLLVLTQSSPYLLTNNYVLTNLSNNIDFKITPKNIRDAITSLWDSTSFKSTYSSNNEYIGLDSGNPSDQYLKRKIYFGKRLYNSTQIMSDSLLNTDTDIFFYNTKIDTGLSLQQFTRLSFLAGNNNNIFNNSPYIESLFVIGTPSNYLSLNINSVNDINFLSRGRDFATGLDLNIGGTVSVNNIIFPEYTSSNGTNNKILRYTSGKLEWWNPTISNTSYYGETGSVLNIYGDPVKVNGYDLEMTDVRMATVNIGDIKMGTTFSSDSIFDVLNRIIYSYTPPICNLNLITPKYLEVGTYPDILLSYKVYKNTKDLLPTKLINMSPGQLPSIGGEGRITADGQAKGLVLLPILATTSIFTIKVDDGVSSTSASQSVTGVYPYYYGFINKNNLKLETNDIIQLTKVVDYSNLNKINLLGSGYNYYLQDKNYKPVSGIYDSKDSTKTNKIKSYSRIAQKLSSPEGYWQYKDYYVYKTKQFTQIDSPSNKYNFVTGITDDSSLKVLLNSKDYKGGLTWSNSKSSLYNALFTTQPAYTSNYITLPASSGRCSIDYNGNTLGKYTFNIVVKSNFDHETHNYQSGLWPSFSLFSLTWTNSYMFAIYNTISYNPDNFFNLYNGYLSITRGISSLPIDSYINTYKTSSKFNINSISHYTLTVDGPSFSYYLNGDLIGTFSVATYSSQISSTFSKIRLGDNNNNNQNFIGDIYHFSLYDRVLSTSEILQNYTSLKDDYEKLDGLYYYGKLNKSSKDPITLNNLLDLSYNIDNKLDKKVVFGTGSLYYIGSVENGPISGIYNTVNNIISTFSRVIQELPSIDGYWAPKNHYIYNSNSEYLTSTELRFSHGVVSSSMSLYIDPMKSINTTDNIIYDMSGNNYHGNIVGDYLYDTNSISLNGYNSFINFGAATPKLYPGTSSFTWDGWLKFGPYTGKYRELWFGNASVGYTGFGLLLDNLTNKIRIEFSNTNPLPNKDNIREVKYLDVNKYLNKWFHLSLSFDSNLTGGFKTMRCYINGGTLSYVGQYTSFTYSSTVNVKQRQNTPLSIGSHNLTNYFYDGSLSDIKFYLKSLNSSEVLQNYYATKDRFLL